MWVGGKHRKIQFRPLQIKKHFFTNVLQFYRMRANKSIQFKTIIKSQKLIIFIYFSDAGKSTIGGQIMFLTGMVDKRTLEKYEREAKEKNRETWYLSWCMDTNQEGKN